MVQPRKLAHCVKPALRTIILEIFDPAFHMLVNQLSQYY